MGAKYKIKPEIEEFILVKAKLQPNLGCRKLSRLVQEQFSKVVSKSTVSAILKAGGLNKSVGRPQIHKKRKPKSNQPFLSSLPTLQTNSLLPTEEKILLAPSLTTAATRELENKGQVEQEPSSLILGQEEKYDETAMPRLPPDAKPAVDGTGKDENPPFKSPYFPPFIKGDEGGFMGEEGDFEGFSVENEPASGLGYWFLKAAELCFGAVQALASCELEINKKDIAIADLIARYETLLYMPLFGIENTTELDKIASFKQLDYIIGQKVNIQEILKLLDYLKSSSKFNLQAVNIFTSHLAEVCGVKFIMEDGSFFFLDGDSHSVWSTPHIPKDFSSPIYKSQSYLKNTFCSLNKPLIIQNSPGFSQPSQALFDFVKGFCSEDKNKFIKRIELHSQDGYLLDTVAGIDVKEHPFVMGLWPWQYEKFRFSEYKDNFTAIEINPLLRFLLVSSEDKFLSENPPFIPLSQRGKEGDFNSHWRQARQAGHVVSYCQGIISLKSDKLNEQVQLRSISLKRDKDEFLTLITNIKETELDLRGIILLYLERWPNLEEGYQYFLNKIKMSTYVKPKPKVSAVNLGALAESQELSLERIFGFWRIKLNEYCQNNFFPSSYKDLDIFHLKERIYELEGKIEAEIGHFEIKFNVQSDYEYLNDLLFACQRVNEKNIIDYSGRRISFSVNIK